MRRTFDLTQTHLSRVIVEKGETKSKRRGKVAKPSCKSRANWTYPGLKAYIAMFYVANFDPSLDKSWKKQFEEKGVYDLLLEGIFAITQDRINCQWEKLDFQFRKIIGLDNLMEQRGLGEERKDGPYLEILNKVDPKRFSKSYMDHVGMDWR